MRLDNGTTDPVDFDQTGGGTDPEDAYLTTSNQSGSLAASGHSGDSKQITPSGKAPFTVFFQSKVDKTKKADSGPFSDPNATVTLNADWTVTVS